MENYNILVKNGGLTINAQGYDYKKLFITISSDAIEKIAKVERQDITYVSVYYRYYFSSDLDDYKTYMGSVAFKDKGIAQRFIEELENVK